MKSKSFDDYKEACIFNDKVNGQIQWCSYSVKNIGLFGIRKRGIYDTYRVYV